jgi:hypothetical protein
MKPSPDFFLEELYLSVAPSTFGGLTDRTVDQTAPERRHIARTMTAYDAAFARPGFNLQGLVSSVTAPSETSRKSLRTVADASLPPDERGKRLRTRLVFRCITQDARPLGPGSPIYLLSISGRENDGRNGSSFVGESNLCSCRAQRARLTALPSAAHQATNSNTAVR